MHVCYELSSNSKVDHKIDDISHGHHIKVMPKIWSEVFQGSLNIFAILQGILDLLMHVENTPISSTFFNMYNVTSDRWFSREKSMVDRWDKGSVEEALWMFNETEDGGEAAVTCMSMEEGSGWQGVQGEIGFNYINAKDAHFNIKLWKEPSKRKLLNITIN